jgi:hypothetical protein
MRPEQRKLAQDKEAMYRRWIAKRKGNHLQFNRFEVLAMVTMNSTVF